MCISIVLVLNSMTIAFMGSSPKLKHIPLLSIIIFYCHLNLLELHIENKGWTLHSTKIRISIDLTQKKFGFYLVH